MYPFSASSRRDTLPMVTGNEDGPAAVVKDVLAGLIASIDMLPDRQAQPIFRLPDPAKQQRPSLTRLGRSGQVFVWARNVDLPERYSNLTGQLDRIEELKAALLRPDA